MRVLLSVHNIYKEDLHPVANSVTDRLSSWKARLMSRAGCTTLTKVTLSTIMVHALITVRVDPWIIKMVDKFHCAFI
jgi:hypothetical protein